MVYGLIGWPLGHSFSKKYFSEKFIREGTAGVRYELFPLENIAGLPALIADNPGLKGLNVTIPHKESVIPFLDHLDDTARAVGAVNCIKITKNQGLTGYNTDVLGFEKSLQHCLTRCFEAPAPEMEALILGTGGAAKAVAYVLRKLGIPYQFVSRHPRNSNEIGYASLITHPASLIVNCTPLGTFPKEDVMPPIPVEIFKPGILVFDLVYNPDETLLLREAKARGCFVQNGLEMLHLQAEAAWEIWQT